MTTILVVDNEESSIKAIKCILGDEDYNLVIARNGQEAVDFIFDEQAIDIILLDRMMPIMDGMDVLRRIKNNPKKMNIPVIMQTALGEGEDISSAYKEGVFYYLTKPYKGKILRSVIKSALETIEIRSGQNDGVPDFSQLVSLMDRGEFHFRTIKEAQGLSEILSYCYFSKKNMLVGISELMINAIEHGNLGITFDEKTQMVKSGTWHKKTEIMLKKPQNINKKAIVSRKKTPEKISLRIEDEGEGFDWKKYLDVPIKNLNKINGRGISMVQASYFDKLEYIGCGNIVVATVYLKKKGN